MNGSALRAAVPLLVAASILLHGCSGGDGKKAGPSPLPSSPTATATATATPAPAATPDPLASRPRTAAGALGVLTALLSGSTVTGCSARVVGVWGAACAEGDIDSDSAPDQAYLIPLDGGPAGVRPAAVIVRRGANGRVESLAPTGDADASSTGAAFFAVAERTGDGGADVIYLSAVCGPNDCASAVHVQAWSGAAWREAGPNATIDNLETPAWTGTGASSRLTLRGGTLRAIAAGPTRAVTSVYALTGGRYTTVASATGPPAYLIHAIADADAIFAKGDFRTSGAVYRSAIESTNLRDWRAENQLPAGRPALVGYAFFRIAIATAASGDDPTEALDTVIRESTEPLFVNAAEAFRKGFQEQGGARAGCVAVTVYLASGALPDYVRAMFDYGYANHPIKTYRDICPL